MARISNITLRQEPAHYTLTMRKTIDFMNDYPDFAEQAFAATSKYLSEKECLPMSGPVVCFHNMDLENLDVELGWQIAQEVTGDEKMQCNLIPSRKVVSAIDLGPYEAQDPTLEDMMGWIRENGYELLGPIWYCYLNDTERPAAEYLTQMLLPVK